jgi:D-sedoheptulose 7-phosphate isomerase
MKWEGWMSTQQNDARDYLLELSEAISKFPSDQVVRVAEILIQKLGSGTLYTAGNGGSASTASHMATDLGVGSLRRKNPLRVISLVDNAAVLTATANDLAFDQIFSQQLLLLGRKNDVFICFSASGNSQNLTNAVADAKKLGMITISVTGFDGGLLKNLTDYNIHISTKLGSYGVVEDVHSTVSHLLTEIIRSAE